PGGPAVVSVGPAGPVPVGRQAVNVALNYRGIPYVLGGASPSAGFDCSGLVQYVYAQLGYSLPHSSGALLGAGYQVTYPEPGDIVWTPGHVAIYAGDGMITEAWAAGMPVRHTALRPNNPPSVRVAAGRARSTLSRTAAPGRITPARRSAVPRSRRTWPGPRPASARGRRPAPRRRRTRSREGTSLACPRPRRARRTAPGPPRARPPRNPDRPGHCPPSPTCRAPGRGCSSAWCRRPARA